MSEDDPFENLDAPEDREGDPFENLDAPEPATEDEETEGEGSAAGPNDDEQFRNEEQDRDGNGPPGAGAEENAGPDTEPGSYSDTGPDVALPPETESASAADADAEPEFEETFIEEDTVGAGNGSPSASAEEPFDGLDAPDTDPFDDGENVFEEVDVEALDIDELWAILDEDTDQASTAINHPVEVSKHRFCEQCPHFAEPPGAHCTHDEAEILEYVGMENVRVLDCPIVAEQRQLENEE